MQSYRHFTLLTENKKENLKTPIKVRFFATDWVFYRAGDWYDLQMDLHVSLHVRFKIQFESF